MARPTTGFPSSLNRRNPIVKNPRSIAGAAALSCILTLATGSAHAGFAVTNVPSVNLTPYHLVLNPDGTCVSASGPNATPNAIVEACTDTKPNQVFYILKSDSDEDFVWQNVPPGTRPSARIVATDAFDSSYGSYIYIEAGANATRPVSVDTNNDNDPVSSKNLWYVNAVPAPAPTWTHVADEGLSFSVGGRRTYRFGANGTYVTKIVEGDLADIDGTAQCTGAFFGAASGSGRTCDVQTSLDTPTPYQVQFESVLHRGSCLTRLPYHLSYQQLVADACNSATPDFPTGWTLVPVPYLQFHH